MVGAGSAFKTLADTFGHRAGYTRKDSQSGYYAFRHHLLTRHTGNPQPYSSITGGLVNARGIIQAMVAQLPSVLAHIQSGKLRALGVAAARRTSVLPALPSMNEAGGFSGSKRCRGMR